MVRISYLAPLLLWLDVVSSFHSSQQQRRAVKESGVHLNAGATTIAEKEELAARKKELLALLCGGGGDSDNNKEGVVDPVLCDPISKEPIRITARDDNGLVIFGGSGQQKKRGTTFDLESPSNKYTGSSDTFLNLLTSVDDNDSNSDDNGNTNSILQQATRQLAPLIPPQLRSILAITGLDDSYIPMRDLFTSPTVSFAYERGWRQGFSAAGFPGADREFIMATEYIAPALPPVERDSVVVDMSCATGLFTRRFAAKDTYGRVLGCDYSDAMLTEARRRISQEDNLSSLRTTQLDLVQLDVGQIPMQDASIDALHAGAAMHCWPDLDAALSEIHRVLKPGGRYFATTFLSKYFSILNQQSDDENISTLAFQNFKSTDTLKELLVRNGFDADKTSLEVLGTACVVIRAEK